MTMLAQQLTGIAYDPDGPEAEEAERYERIATDLRDGVRAVRQELRGATADVVATHVARHLQNGTPARQIAWIRDQLAEAERTSAAVAERREQLTEPDVLTRGRADDSAMAVAAVQRIGDAIRAADPVERPALVRAALESGEPSAVRAVLEDPLAVVFGSVLPPEQMDALVEEYSRQAYPDAWARLDERSAAASRQALYATLTLEAVERVTGVQLLADHPSVTG